MRDTQMFESGPVRSSGRFGGAMNARWTEERCRETRTFCFQRQDASIRARTSVQPPVSGSAPQGWWPR